MTIYQYKKSPTLKYRLARKIVDLATDKNNINIGFEKNKFPSKSLNVKKSSLQEKVKSIYAINGFEIIHVSSKKPDPTVIFYLHGGAYINGILKEHYDFLNKLVDKTNVQMVIPDYPMTPDYNYKNSYPVVEQAYEELLKTSSSENIIFMGDSAGAGYALGLYLKLKESNRPLPKSIVVISPWLDVSMENTEIYKYLIKEPMLKDLNGIQRAGRLYSDGDRYNPLVSPIYGNFKGAPPIHIFIGSNDICYPDSIKFYQQLQDQNVESNLYDYKDMMHCWLLVQSFKESKHAFKKIVNIIRS